MCTAGFDNQRIERYVYIECVYLEYKRKYIVQRRMYILCGLREGL